jgi:hypothetical protein
MASTSAMRVNVSTGSATSSSPIVRAPGPTSARARRRRAPSSRSRQACERARERRPSEPHDELGPVRVTEAVVLDEVRPARSAPSR